MGFFDLFKKMSSGSSGKLVTLETSRKIKDAWDNNIAPLLKGTSPAQLKQALLTADKLLDGALKDIAPGQTMGERMKYTRDILDRGTYQRMWEAHKLRNNMVHEMDFEPQHFVLREAISNLKNVLIKLGVNL